jgi:hypothetical protein
MIPDEIEPAAATNATSWMLTPNSSMILRKISGRRTACA